MGEKQRKIEAHLRGDARADGLAGIEEVTQPHRPDLVLLDGQKLITKLPEDEKRCFALKCGTHA